MAKVIFRQVEYTDYTSLYDDDGKITLTHEDAETLENMISYYHVHTVEKIQEKHPGFVVDDFEKVLAILEKVLEV